jgi:hypothetical protein
MHALLYVLCPKDGLVDSKSARNHVFNWLTENGFTGNGGFFQNYIADWFRIGGRWSGDLVASQMDQEKLQALTKEFEEKHGFWISKDISEQTRQEQYGELLKQYFPDYQGMPWSFRNSYKVDGYEDDAQIVNQKLYDAIIKDNLMDHLDVELIWNGGSVINTDMHEKSQPVAPDTYIGKYWIVVVDFHY